jgi:transcriptional regulator with GAF, ATPase, and Fis domain
MNQTYYLKIASRAPVAVNKEFFTVGYGKGYDLGLEGLISGILFSIRIEANAFRLFPGERKLRVNGQPVTKPTPLHASDRIEWDQGNALFLDQEINPNVAAVKPVERRDPVSILKHLTACLDTSIPFGDSLHLALTHMVEYAGAEAGALVYETKEGAEWALLASVGKVVTRKHLLSETILAEAIKVRKPIFIESLQGHPWENQASIIEAQVSSVACLPLVIGDERVSGALFLSNRTPRRAIDKDSLQDLSLVATQAALLLSTRKELLAAREENRILKIEGPRLSTDLIYDASAKDSPMHVVGERIEKLSPSDLSILIRGETGTGKEVIAKEIHRQSSRAAHPFVALNCAAIPPTLLESLLFGYCKGAFTGANKDKAGKFVQANHGTLFLDEIGDLSVELQTKLLRVLQEKEVEPVGGDEPIAIDIRLLSATHQNLEELVKAGKFRMDLYYRLNGATVQLPPLRQRGPKEILLLAEHFLKRRSPASSFSASARELLLAHAWPGNVRELEQVISRAVALANAPEISGEDLELDPASAPAVNDGDDLAGTLKDVQEQFTLSFIKKTLGKCGGNRLKAAQQLGISERTLYRLLSTDKDGSDLGHES